MKRATDAQTITDTDRINFLQSMCGTLMRPGDDNFYTLSEYEDVLALIDKMIERAHR